VRRAATRADIVIAVLHAGAEGTDRQHTPRTTEYYLGENRGNERRFAHALVYAGANLVLASGPHVLRGMQLFRDTLIAYSLGNFATTGNALSMDGVLNQSGVLVVTLTGDGTIVSGQFLPVQIYGGEPHLTSGAEIVQRVNSLSHQDFGGSAVLVAHDHTLALG
jgi:poly-gamma-glutamate capsule biosynthesis protein CapA/YwtB (metallophosphatase superfamily)